jgi:uncharacterized small protein (DUF1192 family)
LSACALFSNRRLVYDQQGVEVGIEHDRSTDRTSPLAVNSHPARLSEEEVRRLLAVFRVSGYTGTMGYLVGNPQPMPVFKEKELQIISGPIAAALGQAGPQDRIFFSLPNQEVRYSDERTAGALVIRHPYLHLMLRDHNALLRTDTAGGEADKDPRDTKGMRLAVFTPARVATLAPEDVPHWGPLERAFTTVNINEVLYGADAATTKAAGEPISVKPPGKPPSTKAGGQSLEDLQGQIRELTTSNQELQSRLQEQAARMSTLQEEIDRLKEELRNSSSKKSRPKPKTPAKPVP